MADDINLVAGDIKDVVAAINLNENDLSAGLDGENIDEADADSGIIAVTAEKSDAGQRLDVFVSEYASLTRSSAQKLIEEGGVTVNGELRAKKYILCAGDAVRVDIPDPVPDDAQPEDIPLDIVYEDDCMIIVNKPKGMVVHPAAGHSGGTLVNALLYHCGASLSGIGGVLRPGIVHRIDRDTSGLLCVAKNDAAHLSLAAQIKERHMQRVYETIVCGTLETRGAAYDSAAMYNGGGTSANDICGTIDVPIGRHPTDRKRMAAVSGGRAAVTHYQTIRVFDTARGGFGTFTHAKCMLETGRTHQIRVHMAHIGHPVLGDEVYGRRNRFERENADILRGQCLHARTLELVHPVTGALMRFDSPLPQYFTAMLDKLSRLEEN
ncbi:MAG: RluA family pseudouridine synthase [Eubacteriales bacterium]